MERESAAVDGEKQKRILVDPDNDIQLPVYSRHSKRSSKRIILRVKNLPLPSSRS